MHAGAIPAPAAGCEHGAGANFDFSICRWTLKSMYQVPSMRIIEQVGDSGSDRIGDVAMCNCGIRRRDTGAELERPPKSLDEVGSHLPPVRSAAPAGP
jgi:hypothetical protein